MRELPISKQGATHQTRWICFGKSARIAVESETESQIKEAMKLIREQLEMIASLYYLKHQDNIIARINRGTGESIILDEETSSLLDMADRLYELSEGRFDIGYQTGENYSWSKVRWDRPRLWMPKGMAINLNALLTSHAIDRAMEQVSLLTQIPILIQIGNRAIANSPRMATRDWWVNLSLPVTDLEAFNKQLVQHAYVLVDVSRYTNAVTGKPVNMGAKAISVRARSCTEANMLAVLATLKGPMAERYLIDSGADYEMITR